MTETIKDLNVLFAADDAEQQTVELISGRYRATAGVIIAVQDANEMALKHQHISKTAKNNPAGDTQGYWKNCLLAIIPETREVYYIAAEAAGEKQAYDYAVLLNCREIAEQACFGGFSITPATKQDTTHKYDKRPIDIDPASRKDGEKGGVYRFVHTATAAMQYIEELPRSADRQYALGIRCGGEIDHDGTMYSLIGIDIDGNQKNMDIPAGYSERSASRTGQHILLFVPTAEINTTDTTKANKYNRSAKWIRENAIPDWEDEEGEDVELFVGEGNGIALTGYNAVAKETVILEKDDNRMSRLVYGILADTRKEQTSRHAEASIAAGAADDRLEDDIDADRKYAKQIANWEKYETNVVILRMGKGKIPYTEDKASETMMSIMDRIAGDAAEEAVKRGIPYEQIATQARIKKLWEASDAYRELYASGKHSYNDSKIKTTLDKAISDGRKKYDELRRRQAEADAEDEEAEINPEEQAAEKAGGRKSRQIRKRRAIHREFGKRLRPCDIWYVPLLQHDIHDIPARNSPICGFAGNRRNMRPDLGSRTDCD